MHDLKLNNTTVDRSKNEVESGSLLMYAFVTFSHSYARNRQQSCRTAALPAASKLRPRSEAKRSRIVEAATQHFAEHGYHAARVGDIAVALGIAKGSIFQHFGSKDGLFFEVYKRAVRSFAKYLDAPPETRRQVFSRFCVTGWCGPSIWFTKTGFLTASRFWGTMVPTWF